MPPPQENPTAARVSAALGTASDRVLSYEDRLAAAAASVLRTAGRSAARKFGERARASVTAAADWTPPHADELVDVEAIVSALRTKSDPIRRSAIAQYGKALTELHPDASWEVTNPLVGGVLAGAAQHVTDIADTTRINLMRIIGAAHEEGLSIEDTQKAIREGMSAASKVRGRLIARTELAAVTNGGSLAATQILADATGDAYYKRWMTAPGAHYPRHEDYEGLDGQTVALDDAFAVGDASLRFPGDPDGPPEEICNCRCTLAYVNSPEEVIPQAPPSEADVGITPFREGVDEAIGFYDTAKFARFEEDSRQLADRFGVTIDAQERATGVWEGEEEPSVHFTVRDGQTGVRAFSAALARAYRQDGVAIFEPNAGHDVIARFRVQAAPIKEATGKTIEAIATRMGAHELDVTPEYHPELFKKPIKLKGGGYATPRNEKPAPRLHAPADKSAYGQPPRIEDTVENKFGNAEVVAGSERPPEYLYRAISEEDYQQALDKGYLQSDQRMNLADEGTVTSLTDPSFYLPGKLASDADGVYPGRIIRIKYRDEDGWALDRDGYIKTHEPIPMGQVDLVSPKIETVRGTNERHGGPTFETRIVPAGRVTHEEAYAAMEKAGLPAGRFLPDGTLEIIGSGPEFVKQLEAVSGDLGVEYDAYLGKFSLLERDSGDYEEAIGNAQGAKAGQARQAGRGAAELPGHAPLEEGAGGAEAGAQQVGDRVPKLARLPVAPDVTPPTPPTRFTPPYPPSEAARFGADRLWGAHAEIGKLENEARAELPDLRDDQLASLLWSKGMGRGLGKGTIRLDDVAGDQQVHTLFSDGHYTPAAMAREAMARGERQIVISDHSHLMTSAEISDQHELIDEFNGDHPDFKILKGIEANVLSDGSLDVAPEVLAQFDVVNAAIHPRLAIEPTGTEITTLNTPAAVLAEHPGSGVTYAETRVLYIRDAPGTDLARAAVGDLVRYADMRGMPVEINRTAAGSVGRAFLKSIGFEESKIHLGSFERQPDPTLVSKPFTIGGSPLPSSTGRLLKAMDNPELTVLVHPGSVAADWDAVATKASQKGIALEINGRDLLRNDRQEAYSDMIDAAKRHGAKLVLGSDAHTADDLVDLVYAVRFAAQHGVTRDDLAPLALRAKAGAVGADQSTSIPEAFSSSSPGATPLGGGMNEVWKIEADDGREFVVKPDPTEGLMEMGYGPSNPLRQNVEVGADLERERAAYVVSRYFNEAGGDDFHVYVPTYRLGKLERGGDGETVKAGIAEFVHGQEGMQSWDWRADADPDELRSAALFDAVIGNTDRHAGNFMFDDADGHLWLIDHGLAFPAGPGSVMQSTQLVDAAMASISDREVAFLERLRAYLPQIEKELRSLLSPEEITDMAERIDSLIRTRDFNEAAQNQSSVADVATSVV